MRVLELLAQNFGSVQAAATEIINLEAIMNLPKGTEHFVADIHGEHEAFHHILKNASGRIKMKVVELFGSQMREEEIRQLCSLIYYPKHKLQLIRQEETDLIGFYRVTLHKLIRVLQRVSTKYTRSKVRKALPPEFAYIIEELLHEAPSDENKQHYYQGIVETIISTGQADAFIIAICNVIQRLSIDRLHILGDIYDRGPGAHTILTTLADYNGYDIQWGNHDALWMGAAVGNECSMANVLRISLRYDNMGTLEDGYGINLVPLASFAMEVYGEDPCEYFQPKVPREGTTFAMKGQQLTARMHKAISVIQWKLEAAIIARHPEWKMEGRNLLHHIDWERGVIEIDGREFELPDTNFPTIDPADPYRLTEEESELVEKLVSSFINSEPLARHMDIMLSHGDMYCICNSNLMFHASVPLTEDGKLKEVRLPDGKKYKGKALLDQTSMVMRRAFDRNLPIEDRRDAIDYYFYLWCGPDSPLFDKAKMATFERYFLTDKEVRHEEKGHYYRLRNDEATVDMILDDFGVKGEHRHVINGHVPVKVGKGESPLKANGKLMVIDGGFSKAYHSETGIAGYTLVYHSRGFELVQHEPFSSAEEAVRLGSDIRSTTQIVEHTVNRTRVRDTDIGRELQGQIDELRELLKAYHSGEIRQR